jgi:hypothetical protein
MALRQKWQSIISPQIQMLINLGQKKSHHKCICIVFVVDPVVASLFVTVFTAVESIIHLFVLKIITEIMEYYFFGWQNLGTLLIRPLNVYSFLDTVMGLKAFRVKVMLKFRVHSSSTNHDDFKDILPFDSSHQNTWRLKSMN